MKKNKLLYKGFGLCLVMLFAANMVSADKYCQTDKDCVLKYNVMYNDKCSAGCFNSETPTDSWCNSNMVWEPMAGSCVCENNECVLDTGVVCAADAKICPDGSAVGRVPPTCEFAPCPDEPVPPTDISMSVSPDRTSYRVGEQVAFTVKVRGDDRFTPLVIITPPDGYGEFAVMGMEKECTATVPVTCYTYGDFEAEEEGTYTITATIDLGDRDYLSERAKVTVYDGGDGDYYVSMDVYTDKSEYQVGEKARITASLSSDEIDVSNAYVWADVQLPNGAVQEVILKQTLCSETACACREGYECKCPAPTQSCNYEGYVSVAEEGAYYVNAYGKVSGSYAESSTKFKAYTSSGEMQYVRLDQKFELMHGQSAVVVDFGDMRITFDGVDKSEPVVAHLWVRGPQDWETIAYDEDIGVIGGAVKPVYEDEYVEVKEGGSVYVFGAEISFLDYEGGYGLFVVSKEGNGDYVDVKIDPSRQSVEYGEMARYQIIIRDLHYDDLTKRGYNYRLKVMDLPFDLEYDRDVSLGPGQTVTVPLYVGTAVYPTLIGEEPVEAIPNELEMVKPTVAARSVVDAAVKSTVEVTVSEEIEEAEEVVVAHEVTASGRAYKFRVVVYGDDGSEATAYGILNVLYSPPPPPKDLVEIDILQGWNLVTLPGEGELTRGTCSNVDELYAFVYIKELGKYMTLEEATDYLGEWRLKEYLRTNSFWVYSFEKCVLEFELKEETSFNELSLEDGWNFVPITQDMEGNTLGNIGGDCEFERVYYWDAVQQDWIKMGLDERFTSDMVYNGFVAKVDNSCDFGWGAILTPPPLPE